MARKVTNTTRSVSYYDILSQTPKNYSKENYFLRELQDKVNAEWEYRPNRVDIEYENIWGNQTYESIEVVVQSIKSEKGTEIADDTRRIVFQDILEKRFGIGNRFRFSNTYDLSVDDKYKNVWIALNNDKIKFTSSLVIRRCNGTLGSLVQDSQGVSHYHYEPVIQEINLLGVHTKYSDIVVSPSSQIVVTAQCNDITKSYKVNQRFIIGTDTVYRVQSINKFYGNTTFNAEDVGLMHLYLELTETSPNDDFENRIAFQINSEVIIPQQETSEGAEYTIGFKSPEYIPTGLTGTELVFIPEVKDKEGLVVEDIPVTFSYELENKPSTVDPGVYIESTVEGNTVKLRRKRIYLRGNLKLKWTISEEYTNSGESVSISFDMDLRQQ